MPNSTPRSEASTATKISHRRWPPERAASLLIRESGSAAALVLASRELRSARSARSRLRFQFWAKVRDKIDHEAQSAGLAGERAVVKARP